MHVRVSQMEQVICALRYSCIDSERQCDTSDLFDCGVSACKLNRSDRTYTFKIIIIADKAFPAPDRVIGAKTGSVPCEGDTCAVKTVVCHTRSHMRMMMLNLKKWQGLKFIFSI